MTTAIASTRRLGWLGLFLSLTLLGGAWAFAAPYNGPPDEREHVVRAAGVAGGEVAAGRTQKAMGTGATQNVPRGLESSTCWQMSPDHSAACGKGPTGDRTREDTVTRAGRYSPPYYLVVGWPLRWWPSWFGVVLARLMTAMMVAGLLTLAVRSAVESSAHHVTIAGVTVAATPLLFHLAGAVNPAGVEIAAGICLFPAVLPMLHGAGPVHPALIRRAGIAAVTLALVRPLGPVWLVIALGVVLVPSGRERLRTLWRTRAVRAWLAVVAIAVAGGAAWTGIMGAAELSRQPEQVTLTGALKYEILVVWSRYPPQMVGRLSWDDTSLPGWWYVIWYMCFGLLVVGALLFGRWVDRWRLVALAVGAVIVPTITDVVGAQTYGFVSQGRYLLPALVGLPIIGAYVLGERGVLNGPQVRNLIRGIALVLFAVQFGALYFTMIRWQQGLAGDPSQWHLNVLAGAWRPVLGPVLPLALMIAGLTALLGYCWRLTAGNRPAGHLRAARPDEDPSIHDGHPRPVDETSHNVPAPEGRHGLGPGSAPSTSSRKPAASARMAASRYLVRSVSARTAQRS